MPSASTTPAPLQTAPFGAANRRRLIDEHFGPIGEAAWTRIYKLLLWTDKTTGLAHCYESDKCQPGKPWHPRSLRFHMWLANALGVSPGGLDESIDVLFRHTAEDHARWMVRQYQTLLRRAALQRAPFVGMGLPEPGEDPAIVEIVRDVLGARLTEEPSPDEWRSLTRRVRELVSLENKRKNLVGEGFEDVLCAIVKRFDSAGTLEVRARCTLADVPGFANLRVGDKPVKIDLAVVRRADGQRTLVTAKWSVRADRERQFQSDFADYVRAKSDMRSFDYVLLTNEFDPARLLRACEFSIGNAPMFSRVVHISPAALRAVFGDRPEVTMSRVVEFIDQRRIIAVDDWLTTIV
jgi:hypothetical protein